MKIYIYTVLNRRFREEGQPYTSTFAFDSREKAEKAFKDYNNQLIGDVIMSEHDLLAAITDESLRDDIRKATNNALSELRALKAPIEEIEVA